MECIERNWHYETFSLLSPFSFIQFTSLALHGMKGSESDEKCYYSEIPVFPGNVQMDDDDDDDSYKKADANMLTHNASV